MALISSLLALGACKPPPAPSSGLPSGPAGIAAWREARGEVEALRARWASSSPYTMNVALSLGHVQLGGRLRARGAVAVQPPHAMRMILLGPGGTTAFDLWICRDRFRLAIPAFDLERRGDAASAAEELRGMPVAFLRWWFLDPLGGSLLAFADGESGRRYVLRDDDGQILHLEQLGRDRLSLLRMAARDEEQMQIAGGACGQVNYRQRSTGIDILVECEQRELRAAPARAFADPDDPNRACTAEVQR